MKEIRYVDPVTGAEKGVKLVQYHCFPTEAVQLLAMQYAYGSGKYADNNYRKGMPWSLNFNAAKRHLDQFWAGEDLDHGDEDNPGSGLPHPVAAAWHCLALTQAMIEHPDKDDRPEPISEESLERFKDFIDTAEDYYQMMLEKIR